MVSGLNRKLFRDVASLKYQTITLAALIICGVAVLVSSWSSYESLKQARDSYYDRYGMGDVFADIKRAPLDVFRKVSELPGLEIAEARIIEQTLVDVANQAEPATGNFLSLPDRSEQRLNRVYLRQGRMPEAATTPEAVVHEAFAEAHKLKPGDTVDALFRGQKKTVRITGIGLSPEFVYSLNPVVPFPDDKHFGVFWMPRSTLEKLAQMEGSFNNVSGRLEKGASLSDVKAGIDRILAPYGCRGAIGRDRQLSNQLVSDEIREQRVMAFFNPAVFFSVAAFLIHIVISRLIGMHRTQIATLKSIGYRDGEIGAYYAKLVCLMLFMGIVPGLLVGAWLGRVYSDIYQSFFRFPHLDFIVSLPSIFIGIGASLIPGLAGAAHAVRSVFKLSPAQAMLPPSPPPYREGFLEKRGLIRFLDLRERMVVRGFLLRPWRLMFTILGMSAALAIVISGGFWVDMLDFVIETQFSRLNREDISVSFLHNRPRAALRELSQIPGVTAVEGYRAVPVRVRSENHSRESAILVMDPLSGMRRALDADGSALTIPERGILLSRYFEDTFGLSAGDPVELELLEGAPRRVWLPVSGFADDLIGVAAYARPEQIQSALGESPSYSMAALKVDPALSQSVYERLKTFPEVISVNSKVLLYEGFQSTMAGMIRFFTGVLIGFAVVISLAVIYNAARVSFSERGWELACLRILGFDSGAVWQVLFLEVTLQVFLSVLPGFALGNLLSRLSAAMIHSESFRFPFYLETSTYAFSALLIAAIWLMNGWLIRRMVGSLKMVEALKARD